MQAQVGRRGNRCWQYPYGWLASQPLVMLLSVDHSCAGLVADAYFMYWPWNPKVIETETDTASAEAAG